MAENEELVDYDDEEEVADVAIDANAASDGKDVKK